MRRRGSRGRAAVAATAGAKSEPKSTERSAEEYGDRMEAQKVEIRTEEQIRAAGEEEVARAGHFNMQKLMKFALDFYIEKTMHFALRSQVFHRCF